MSENTEMSHVVSSAVTVSKCINVFCEMVVI